MFKRSRRQFGRKTGPMPYTCEIGKAMPQVGHDLPTVNGYGQCVLHVPTTCVLGRDV